jgi:hypothetical protein
MKSNIAQFFSILFHPLFAGTYTSILIYGLYDWNNFFYQITGINKTGYLITNIEGNSFTFFQITFFITALLPILFFFLLKKTGFISSIEMDNKKERIIPYLFCLTCYTSILLYTLWMGLILEFYIFGGIILTLFICFIINLFWKISAHCTSVAGLIPICIAVHNIYGITDSLVFFSIIVAGIIGTSRLYLQKHTIKQVFLGYATGFIIMSFSVELGIISYYL